MFYWYTDDMKQWIFGILISVVVAVAGGAAVSAASTNNFAIKDYTIDYYLDRNDERRSTLKTVETITSEFSKSDENHGLERALPQVYDGHKTNLKVTSIKDAQGRDLSYTAESEGDNLIIRIGDKYEYVHGLNTYVITYTQQDVTRRAVAAERDEFYWDTNGTDWKVPIEKLAVTVTIADSLAPAYIESSCYIGARGSNQACPVQVGGAPLSLSMSAVNVKQTENITIAAGFNDSTFSGYAMSKQETLMMFLAAIWVALIVVALLASAVILPIFTIRWRKLQSRRRDLGTVVPEYLPPSDYSVMTSEEVMGINGRSFSAQLIDLAVRHYLKIYQTRESSLLKAAQYEIELVKSPADLFEEEQDLLKVLFPDLVVGSRFDMTRLKSEVSLGVEIRDVIRTSLSARYKLRESDKAKSKAFKDWAIGLLIVAVLTLSPVFFITSMVLFGQLIKLKPYTDQGLKLKRYLLGLKMYIGVAEAERLKMLQSPDGAEKTGVSIADGDSINLIRLYERVLPYAVLFNQETEWNKRLGAQYAASQQQPDWYAGQGVFNAAVLGSALSGFSQASTYVAPSSDTSSGGGSGGGGYSGGGGGGGGGGGW